MANVIQERNFEEFILDRCRKVININFNAAKEQRKNILEVYKLGYLDALKTLEAKSKIKVSCYK